jgi:hypothetical protein
MWGVREKWQKTSTWLQRVPRFPVFSEPHVVSKIQFPGIPVLKSYTADPGPQFWKVFPSNGLPASPRTKVNTQVLDFKLCQYKNRILQSEYIRGKRLLQDLVEGASSSQKRDIPGCVVRNSYSTSIYGREVTDSVASWLSKGFAAGPFDSPPLARFRSNCIIAVKQCEKVRTVIDLSSPKGYSFNDNIDEAKLEKVYMTSVKQFARNLSMAGKSANISKLDMVDAYKNVPCQTSELRIQGFCWLSKYFVETQQIFGAKSAVPNFDRLGHTILALALADSDIQKCWVHRTLDDVPVISPAHTSWGESFVSTYLKLCEELNIDVTTSCPKNEKAFISSHYGKVLGVYFDTEKCAWKLPEQKVSKTLQLIKEALDSTCLNLKDFQRLMGRLNFSGQLSLFMQGFKFNLNKVLGQLQRGDAVSLSTAARHDLYVWANFLLDGDGWHTLCTPHFSPPLAHDTYVSDAAGCSQSHDMRELLGCGNVGINWDEEIFFMSQLFWPAGILQHFRDGEGKLLGQKTTTLEFLGILVPFMLCPEDLAGKYVVVKVDNTSCFFGWINRQSPGDETASILIRCLHLICSALHCEVHIEHLPRVSTWEAMLVDRLSRGSTTTPEDKKQLAKFQRGVFPETLFKWMRNPVEDWNFPYELTKEVLKKVKF